MQLGIPYMGSKRRLAKKIIDVILKENPQTKYLYDLFGGGGAVSLEALNRPDIETVFYNEIDTGVAELMKKLITEGVTDEMYQWVNPDMFKRHKDDNSWFGGLVSTCWSFGNNKKNGYLYGEKVRMFKSLLHSVIVNKCQSSLSTFNRMYGTSISMDKLTGVTINERRLQVQRLLTKFDNKDRIKIHCNIKNGNVSCRTQHLERIRGLENIERIQQTDRLNIYNLSYEQVKINTPISETVIYLDPPYQNTAKYESGINYGRFYKFVGKHEYTVYVSGYDMPFNEVARFEHNTKMSATNNKKTIEKLYRNK